MTFLELKQDLTPTRRKWKRIPRMDAAVGSYEWAKALHKRGAHTVVYLLQRGKQIGDNYSRVYFHCRTVWTLPRPGFTLRKQATQTQLQTLQMSNSVLWHYGKTQTKTHVCLVNLTNTLYCGQLCLARFFTATQRSVLSSSLVKELVSELPSREISHGDSTMLCDFCLTVSQGFLYETSKINNITEATRWNAPWYLVTWLVGKCRYVALRNWESLSHQWVDL